MVGGPPGRPTVTGVTESRTPTPKSNSNPPSFSLFPSVQILFKPSVILTTHRALRNVLPTFADNRLAGVRIEDQAAPRKLEMMFSPMIVIKLEHVKQSPGVLVK